MTHQVDNVADEDGVLTLGDLRESDSGKYRYVNKDLLQGGR